MIKNDFALTEEFLSRFWAKVEKLGDGCWNWKASKNKDGYGQFWIMNGGRPAHRVSWAIHFGFIPNGLCVLHRCDNPGCVNPEHLFLGTRGDNNRDRDKKGRGVYPRGAKHGHSKLNPDIVREIRNSYPGMSQRSLAKKYHISQRTIGRVLHRENWTHID